MLQLIRKLEAEKNGGGIHSEGYNIKNIYPKEIPIHYINSEMSPAELKARVHSLGSDISQWEQWVKFYRRNHSFHQRVHPDGLSIIDYLEVVGDFTQAGSLILQVHERLNTGIAVIGLQKNANSELGYGGALTTQKPRLYINLKKNMPHGFIAQAVKVKEPRNFRNKIEGMQLDYHITQDGQFVPDSGWRYLNKNQRGAINADYNRKYKG
jgi:hypothetical protein